MDAYDKGYFDSQDITPSTSVMEHKDIHTLVEHVLTHPQNYPHNALLDNGLTVDELFLLYTRAVHGLPYTPISNTIVTSKPKSTTNKPRPTKSNKRSIQDVNESTPVDTDQPKRTQISSDVEDDKDATNESKEIIVDSDSDISDLDEPGSNIAGNGGQGQTGKPTSRFDQKVYYNLKRLDSDPKYASFIDIVLHGMDTFLPTPSQKSYLPYKNLLLGFVTRNYLKYPTFVKNAQKLVKLFLQQISLKEPQFKPTGRGYTNNIKMVLNHVAEQYFQIPNSFTKVSPSSNPAN